MRTRPRQTGLLTALLATTSLVIALALAPSAQASDQFMWSVMQDDNQLIYDDADNRQRALDYMKVLGVDAVRVTVLWEAIAPRRKPRRSTALISSYPRKNWDRYDELVKDANARGLVVYFSVTGPGPSWAHARSPERANRRTWKPNARHFGNFIRALGKRYSGEYKDENAGRTVIPRVSWWGVFNEPNQGGWLTPQAQEIRGVRGWTPTSPALYRDLLVEGVRGLLATRHENDVVFMGETAPLGVDPQGERRPLRPAEFIRELFCLDNRMRSYRGRRARARNCSRVRRLSILKRLPNLGFAHHPYTKDTAPSEEPGHADAITIANVRALPALLDRIAQRTNLIPEGLPIYLTEFGYESNPPDIINGIPAEQQAEWINQGDYLAYRAPRVVANTQFQLFDVPPQTRYRVDSREYWFTYQSGIFMHDGTPKPAAGAYALPFEARPIGAGGYLLWGWVRLGANNTAQTIYLQRKDETGTFQNVGDPLPVSNPGGFWELPVAAFPGETWRYAWVSPDGTDTRVSREILLR